MSKPVVVRIVGFASTHRGFGFAVTEGPRRLVKWNLHQTSTSRVQMTEKVGGILRRYRPLFVAFEESHSRDGRRNQSFIRAVEIACQTHGIMTLPIKGKHLRSICASPRPTKWHLASTVAGMFPEIRGQLPPRRKRWTREDDRIGLFVALAAAVSAWEGFRRGSR
jgi:hypothetical protein